MWPSIDHSLISPSGRKSKRAVANALERFRVELFGKDGLQIPAPKLDQKEYLTRKIREFSEWRDRGVTPRKMQREINRMTAELLTLATKGE